MEPAAAPLGLGAGADGDLEGGAGGGVVQIGRLHLELPWARHGASCVQRLVRADGHDVALVGRVPEDVPLPPVRQPVLVGHPQDAAEPGRNRPLVAGDLDRGLGQAGNEEGQADETWPDGLGESDHAASRR